MITSESRQLTPRGFTLVEMVVVTMIISVLASMILFAMSTAQEKARREKTKAMITTLDRLIMERWNQFHTRRVVPVATSSGYDVASAMNQMRDPAVSRQVKQRLRLDGLRLAMRVEFPDRWSDLGLPQGTGTEPPTHFQSGVYRAYQLHFNQYWEPLKDKHSGDATAAANNLREFQGAECLYMIINYAVGDGSMSGLFKESDIGDLDQDGYPEILDAWGTPIAFIRWPAGFRQGAPGAPTGFVSDRQPGDFKTDPDPFDPDQIDNQSQNANRGFRLVPLVYSAGADRRFDIFKANDQTVALDPYVQVSSGGITGQIGTPIDANNNDENDLNGNATGNGVEEWHDNLHNHLIE